MMALILPKRVPERTSFLGLRCGPLIRFVLLALLAWFSWLMLRITVQYWPVRDDVAFLLIKRDYLGIIAWKVAFFVHVFTSLFALAAGFTQFSPRLLGRWPAVHRAMGRLYVLDVCLVTGPASLIMARYANGGWISRVAFITLAVLWIGTTAMGYRTALRRHWQEHRAWMMRSYALTLSALSLRAWKYLFAWTLHPHPMDLYRVVAWLGFVPNLLLAEWLIRRWRQPARRTLPSEPGRPTNISAVPARRGA